MHTPEKAWGILCRHRKHLPHWSTLQHKNPVLAHQALKVSCQLRTCMHPQHHQYFDAPPSWMRVMANVHWVVSRWFEWGSLPPDNLLLDIDSMMKVVQCPVVLDVN